MKKLLSTIIMYIAIFVGVSFVVFVFKMIWYPPQMGMMINHDMMFSHMFYWMRGTFGIVIALIIIIFVIDWFLSNRNK